MISVHDGKNCGNNEFNDSGITVKEEPFDPSEDFEKLPLLIKTEPDDPGLSFNKSF